MNGRPTILCGGRVVTADGSFDGYVVVESGRIVDIGRSRPPAGLQIDVAGALICAGLIDLQVNGADGIDVTTEPSRIAALAAALPKYGVTTFLPTVISAPAAARTAALDAWPPAVTASAATPLGLHFEGPMLSPARRGAHPAGALVAPDAGVIDGWSAAAGVRLTTLAPELPGARPVIEQLVSRGVTVAVGHTDGSAADVAAAFATGASYVTHLFNAMRPFAHRDPGPIGATLADAQVVAGLICDGAHVDPVAIAMAWRALGPDRVNVVTDAVAAMGMPADASTLGATDVVVDGGTARTTSGTLAGGTVPLARAVWNLAGYCGCRLPDAVRTVTSTPAAVLGLTDRGQIVEGARADLTVLDPGGVVRLTMIGGEVAWRS